MARRASTTVPELRRGDVITARYLNTLARAIGLLGTPAPREALSDAANPKTVEGGGGGDAEIRMFVIQQTGHTLRTWNCVDFELGTPQLVAKDLFHRVTTGDERTIGGSRQKLLPSPLIADSFSNLCYAIKTTDTATQEPGVEWLYIGPPRVWAEVGF